MDAAFVSPANVYRPPPDVAPEDVTAFCAEELVREIESVGAENICAFIFEPLVGAAGGAVPAPPGYAQRMREVCDNYGVLMIADEVMCGVGRTGYWRALEFDGVVPDIMSVAKGLGGGYMPLGAAIYHDKVAEAILEQYGTVLTGHTFAGHTAACAAGVAVQHMIERDGLLENVRRNGQWLMEALRGELAQHPHVGDIRGRGFFLGVELVSDLDTKEPFDPSKSVYAKIGQESFSNGLICYPVGGNVDGERGDIVILSPPFNASRSELEEIVDKFSTTCRSVLGSI